MGGNRAQQGGWGLQPVGPNNPGGQAWSGGWGPANPNDRGVGQLPTNQSYWGSAINPEPGTSHTMDIKDSNSDGMDDRYQPNPGGQAWSGGWGDQTGGWQSPYRNQMGFPGGPGPIGGSVGMPPWAQAASQRLTSYQGGYPEQTNPYMNLGKRFNTAESEADYWNQDRPATGFFSPQQQQDWEAGKQGYQDRLVQDEQDLMDRKSQWADSFSTVESGGDMSALDKFQRMQWASGQGGPDLDFSDEFSGSQYGMSDLDRYRSDRTSSMNEIQELQRRLMELQGGFANQYYSGGGRVRRR